ncbi:uncharacterized protein B0J16DRAFT_405193 [Fusarium flagelliforme]|uniref:uncharacterized protein n=1 Tax=Fusarium flagelliforme TaxID=2675880 RepID=UPI001E8CA579|nr:uncharacterized protein B0J16DRAFT_405193 [Fusarium flagelliforme]KAH7175126.1 hypothetical protein B0J16DRAFT_405193 [Fusarium flagelliforme]
MIQPLSKEPAKPRRKKTRRVSTLTPEQLARKRANDREAQRAIRIRTREHIERLERELAELKSNQGRGQTIQDLLRRNTAIERELIRLKEIMGAPMASLSSHEAPLTARQPLCPDKLSTSAVCNGNLSTGNDAIPSPAPFSRDYNILYDYNQQYIPLSNNCGHLASTISCTNPSNISTPSSTGDYSAGQIQVSMPNSALPFYNTSSSRICTLYNKDVVKIEYIEGDYHGAIPRTLHQSDMMYCE